MKKNIERAITIVFLCASFFLARKCAALASYGQEVREDEALCIVLDAGHGANDPGKVGVNGVLEKDVNLAITLKLATMLENKGYKVVLTRDSDAILADENSKNQKRDDMVNRVKVMEEASPVFAVSIHQNSFSNGSACGPQVFYYTGSETGKELAAVLQESLNDILETENPRTTKANSEYYLLKKTPTSTVIVECGFLSNENEAALLATEAYQEKVARAIYFGICRALH